VQVHFKEWSISAALAAAILAPVVPAVAGSFPQGQASSPAPPAGPPDPAQQNALKKALPPGTGRDELIRVCTGCHLLSVITLQRKSESDWTDVAIEMRGRGAIASDEDLENIVEYLAKNFGPQSAPAKINANTASASDLAAGLSLTPDQSQAIVDYRTKNGNFKGIEELKKVPGIDASKIDAAKDRIEF
jgi:competence protein ComEA